MKSGYLAISITIVAVPAGLDARQAGDATRPAAVDHATVPIAFADDPVVQANVGSDQPFVEGHLTYGYAGRVTTDVRSGKRVIVPAGSPAYGIPMLSSVGGGERLIWCAIPTPPREHLANVCLLDATLSGSANDSLLTTGLYAQKNGAAFTGGTIEPAPFTLGAPIRVAYYIQHLGKITRIRGEAWVGDVKANQWGIIWGTIMRPAGADEKLIAVGGGVVGVRADPTAKDRYIVRTLTATHRGGSAVLQEIRNDPVRPLH